MEFEKIIKLSPWISSPNLGDQIIRDYCDIILDGLFPESCFISIPTHDRLSRLSMNNIASSDYSIVCGTNLLTSHMMKYRQWNVYLRDAISLNLCGVPKRKILDRELVRKHARHNKVILLGAGWWQYQDVADFYTRILLKLLLSETALHSVRDSYSEKQLKDAGIKNVINTSCPTMWTLSEEHCKSIPTTKKETVITTLTNYNSNLDKDMAMLEILLRQYNRVYIWLQSTEDHKLLAQTPYLNKVGIVGPSLKSYDRFLAENECDYVGTRLHGGIRAMNYKHRSIIVAVDNRAVEISKDTDLCVLKRDSVGEDLERLINTKFETKLILPWNNIEKWKRQFTTTTR